VQQGQPQVQVRPGQPDVDVETRRPQVAVQQARPEVQVQQARPDVDVETGQPDVDVRTARPDVDIRQTEPEVAVRQAEPQVSVERGEVDVDVRSERRIAPVGNLRSMVGRQVQTGTGEDVGEVEDILLAGGDIDALIIRIDEELFGEERLVRVPYRDTEMDADMVVIPLEAEQLERTPAFEYRRGQQALIGPGNR